MTSVALSSVSLSSITLPVAAVGPDNPLPPLGRPPLVTVPVDTGIADEQMQRNMAYGRPRSILPYTVQDGYIRQRDDAEIPTAIVENDHIRAEFLLGYGGRMWSLFDKQHQRELLYRNAALQPANLGLRNAWFAGGVEWNLGTTGHSALTCAPMHAARVIHPDGTQALRLWEFERMRELVYQLDVWAPAGSSALHVQVRITNPNQHEVPVYWWSNIAVPDRPGTRVLAPARRAWHLGHDGILRKVPAPEHLDQPHAADYFYDITPDTRPWIAALGVDGYGLLQASTSRLRGRKLFTWGRSTGGQRWQEWLSPDGGSYCSYLEIQAGLARTQLEHLPMPADARWSWLETYQPAAQLATDELVVPDMPEPDDALGDLPPAELLHDGSGWGALESLARGKQAWDLAGTPFPAETLGGEQASWLALLETGAMPAPAPRLAPNSYQVSPLWTARLASAEPNWFTLLHLGVCHWHHGDQAEAIQAWTASIEATPNPWALRNLAHAQPDTAVDRLRQAHGMAPALPALAVEAIEAMLTAGKPDAALTFIDRLLPQLRTHGRIRLLECRAALDAGQIGRAGRIVDAGIVVDDLREGEDALDALWFRYHHQRGTTPVPQLPCLYDFRTGAPQ